MAKGGDGAGFALEAGLDVWGRGGVRAKDFNGDIPIEAGVAGAVDLAHAADSERGLDLVGAEAGVWREGHRSAIPRTQFATWAGGMSCKQLRRSRAGLCTERNVRATP